MSTYTARMGTFAPYVLSILRIMAGLLFFEYRGKTKKIRSIELIYSGPAGKAALDLQP